MCMPIGGTVVQLANASNLFFKAVSVGRFSVAPCLEAYVALGALRCFTESKKSLNISMF